MKGIVIYDRSQALEQSELSYHLSDRRHDRRRGYGDKDVAKAFHRRRFWKRNRKETSRLVEEYNGVKADYSDEIADIERAQPFSIFRTTPIVLPVEDLISEISESYNGLDEIFEGLLTGGGKYIPWWRL